MDISTVAAVGGLLAAVAGVSANVFSMDPAKRSEWVGFWRMWLTVVFVIVIVVNSVIGIYLFVQGPPQLVRADIFKLALHLFNLLAPPLIWFFDAIGTVMDERNAKRLELAEEVAALRSRIEDMAARLKRSPLELEEQSGSAA